jgi:hypothetical protein
VAALGEITGSGMIIAYFTSITLLPALRAFAQPARGIALLSAS